MLAGESKRNIVTLFVGLKHMKAALFVFVTIIVPTLYEGSTINRFPTNRRKLTDHSRGRKVNLIARFMGSTRGPPGAARAVVGPMLATWKLLSGQPGFIWCPKRIAQTFAQFLASNCSPIYENWSLQTGGWYFFRQYLHLWQLFIKYAYLIGVSLLCVQFWNCLAYNQDCLQVCGM